MTTTLLLDNSAWVRLADASLPTDRAEEIAASLESGRIAACLPFLLEAGYSACDAREQEHLLAELRSLPQYHLDDIAERRALHALADRYELGVLHYDHDYDVIVEKTDLSFDSVWLAARGTL